MFKVDKDVKRLHEQQREFEEYQLEGRGLFCVPCTREIPSSRRSLVTQHLQTRVRIRNREQLRQNEPAGKAQNEQAGEAQNYQTNLQANPQPGPNQQPSNESTGHANPNLTSATLHPYKRTEFHEDLTRAFIAADIPLNKFSNAQVKAVVKKYTGRNIPDQTTLRKYYVADIFEMKVNNIRIKAAGQNIWISMDETTDVEHRYIACFVFGVLGVEEERKKCHSSSIAVLQAVNHATIATFMNDSLKEIYHRQVSYENILVA